MGSNVRFFNEINKRYPYPADRVDCLENDDKELKQPMNIVFWPVQSNFDPKCVFVSPLMRDSLTEIEELEYGAFSMYVF